MIACSAIVAGRIPGLSAVFVNTGCNIMQLYPTVRHFDNQSSPGTVVRTSVVSQTSWAAGDAIRISAGSTAPSIELDYISGKMLDSDSMTIMWEFFGTYRLSVLADFPALAATDDYCIRLSKTSGGDSQMRIRHDGDLSTNYSVIAQDLSTSGSVCVLTHRLSSGLAYFFGYRLKTLYESTVSTTRVWSSPRYFSIAGHEPTAAAVTPYTVSRFVMAWDRDMSMLEASTYHAGPESTMSDHFVRGSDPLGFAGQNGPLGGAGRLMMMKLG